MRRNMPPAEAPSLTWGSATSHMDAYRYTSSYDNDGDASRLTAHRHIREYGFLARIVGIVCRKK